MLKPQTFDDGIRRKLAFSSGNSHYFAPRSLYRAIKAFFQTEPDSACRYGSLLSSDCYEGLTSLEGVRVKLVDYTNPDDAHWQTNDCHGKISAQLAALVGGEPHKPLQFRLAYDHARWQDGNEQSALVNFLAKGTVIVEDSLTTQQGYDLVLDISSIKGIDKQQLKTLIPTGDYELPRAVLGNRQNATANQYNNSWQFTVCYSADAIAQDFGPATARQLAKLMPLRDNPLALRQWILDEYDQKKQQHPIDDEADVETAWLGDEGEAADDPSLIRILRTDTLGLLLNAPKVQQFMQTYLRRKIADLAIKGGYRHQSGMAMPSNDLRPGHVCIPHLPAGETVIVARSPIPDKDHIRKYHNIHLPHLTRYKNTVWMNPDDAARHHQGDFDGDQMIVSLASKLPMITRETRWANDPHRDFPEVIPIL
jgi:hypothetical protein